MAAPQWLGVSVLTNVQNTVEASLITLREEDAVRDSNVAKVFVVVDHWEARIIVPLELN